MPISEKKDTPVESHCPAAYVRCKWRGTEYNTVFPREMLQEGLYHRIN